MTQNRTAWPISGGAIALQPGWFAGHADNLMYINLGVGSQPDNYTVMHPMFEIIGPSNQPYPGTICLPQVTLPGGISPKSGDEATIQIVQAFKHGAALYSVSCTDSCTVVCLIKVLTVIMFSARTLSSRMIYRRSQKSTTRTASTRQISKWRLFSL